MNLTKRLLFRLRQLGLLLPLIAVTLPLAALVALGGWWLFENGVWLPFVGLCLGLAGLTALVRLAGGWYRAAGSETSLEDTGVPRQRVLADTDWTEKEANAFDQSCARIEAATHRPMDWDALRPIAEAEMTQIAHALRGADADPWDFSVPEGLLLMSRVSLRFRTHLLDVIPFSDAVKVRQLRTLWKHSDDLLTLTKWAGWAYRGGRIALNPVSGALAELRDALTGPLGQEVSNAGIASLQALLLEEVARSAVDLYAGRLRLTEAELSDRAKHLARARGDQAGSALDPLAIMVMGQLSAGKTALIDALRSETAGLSGPEPITRDFLRHDWTVDGLPCALIDTPGLGQSEATDQELAEWVDRADMVIWTLAANRPAREPDRAFLHAMRDAFASRPERQPPPVIVVSTFADRLVASGDWPYPEHHLPPETVTKLAQLDAALRSDLDLDDPVIPVVALNTPGAEWNIAQVRYAIAEAIDEAATVQRIRTHTANDGLGREIARNSARILRLASTGATEAAPRALKRMWNRLLQR